MSTPTLVEQYDGTPLIGAGTSSRQRSYLRLGTQVDHDMGLEEALRLGGSDDHVYPVSLFDLEGWDVTSDLPEAEEGITGIKSDKYGIMGYRSNSYTITQRRDILELAYDIAGLDPEGSHIDTIGNVGERAQKFFAYIKVPDLVVDPNGIADTIERGLYVATSFDGTWPNIIGYSDTRIACLNELRTIFKGLQQAIKVRHTRNAEERMKVAAQAQGYVGAVQAQMAQNAESMLRVKDGDKALGKLLDTFWPVPDDLSDMGKTRRMRERGDVRMLYEGQSNTNVDLVGRNGWAAYNAVVEYMDHFQGVKGVKGDKASIRRAERAFLPGTTVDSKVKASAVVLSMAA